MKHRVFIYGSCVSRDSYEYFDAEQFELAEYVARQSAISAYTRPVELMAPPLLDSPFQQRMVSGDFHSSLPSLLRDSAGSIDLFLIDLTDERLGVYILPDGSVVTRSLELISSGAENSIPPGSHHIAFGSDVHLQYWTQGIQAIASLLQTHHPRAGVALLDIPWASTSETGAPTPPSFGVGALEANGLYRPYIEAAARILDAQVVSFDARDVLSSPQHPWGDAPFHYAEAVYEFVAQQLGGRSPSSAPRGTASGDMPAPRMTLDDTGTSAAWAPRSNPDVERLVATSWHLQRTDGTNKMPSVRLLPDGTVAGTKHENEGSWRFVDGQLAFCKKDGTPTTIFTSMTEEDGRLRFTGRFVLLKNKNFSYELSESITDWGARGRPASLTRKHFAKEIERHGWEIGDHTYGKPTVRELSMAPLSIGKFTSIGPNVTILLGNHKADSVTTYPFHQLRKFWPNGEHFGPDHTTRGPVVVGNDVWIGAHVIIGSGVTIGDGSIIAAGATVTRDVPPYTVVGGVPAKPIKKRFSDSQIDALLAIRWWEWSDEDIDALLPYMGSSDIDLFIKMARNRPVR